MKNDLNGKGLIKESRYKNSQALVSARQSRTSKVKGEEWNLKRRVKNNSIYGQVKQVRENGTK